MESMFYSTKISDVSALANWNVSSVTNMWSMSRLGQTQFITTMYCMFYGCSNLTDVSALANWNTSSVDSMRSMFNSCSTSQTRSSYVTNMWCMFYECSNLFF